MKRLGYFTATRLSHESRVVAYEACPGRLARVINLQRDLEASTNNGFWADLDLTRKLGEVLLVCWWPGGSSLVLGLSTLAILIIL